MKQGTSKVSERVKGRWKSVLSQLGIDERVLDGEHHPCPVTGEGDDRFRFSNYKGRGNFFCACNDGKSDGFKLLECRFGADFPAAAKMVESVIGESEEDQEAKRTTEHAMRDLRMIQDKVRCCQEFGAVRDYLVARGIPPKDIPAGALRQAQINYGLRKIGITQPMTAMVAKVVTADDQPCTFHLTYLEGNQKAKIERSRVVATPAQPMGGSAVRLHPMGENGILGVAEGIETALSARALFPGLPVWATLNAMMLEQFVPPPGCKQLLIFGDNDASFTGHAAAYALAKKCATKFRVRAEVHIPPVTDTDWNDVLLQQRGAK